MKKILFIILIAVGFISACSPVIYTNTVQPVNQNYPDQSQQYADQNAQVYNNTPQTTQVFYDELSAYGNWINYPDYGYVWQPNADADFRPYATNGNWVYSDYGWTWVSNYNWGWAPFHYGRWFYDDNYGWLWMPGQEWAPAWVTWAQSGDYYGWAPVPPRVDYNSGWRPQNSDWNFVRARNIIEANINNYVVKNTVTVINHTTIVNNVTNNTTINNTVIYNRGPKAAEVENLGNIKIQPVKISGSNKPGQSLNNNQLIVYRPVIKQNALQGNNKPSPRRVIQYKQNGGPGSNGKLQNSSSNVIKNNVVPSQKVQIPQQGFQNIRQNPQQVNIPDAGVNNNQKTNSTGSQPIKRSTANQNQQLNSQNNPSNAQQLPANGGLKVKQGFNQNGTQPQIRKTSTPPANVQENNNKQNPVQNNTNNPADAPVKQPKRPLILMPVNKQNNQVIKNRPSRKDTIKAKRIIQPVNNQ